ncbi:hypothetical protein D9V37_09340 [Nocardioides mangrovicus]|uniref:Uncharacterized protein n=1 Tax=Nocardioides mangrovicus TaxID=2478913 RepID=A0A3L8P449_9ACTN|nr:hypothetical protein [Nocardioides mangrovicus]RLV50055.1 hypothetical protein D9V37_09340 [Nocardioides mangrovicus]
MSHAPAPQQFDEPTWAIQVVFDPDEPWRDFAYTVGLVERGLPELHAYAYPSLGEDAAPDWRFGARDLCALLDAAAARLVAGDIAVGSEWLARYDDGLTTVSLRLDPPGDRDQLEAWLVEPDAQVLPVRWSVSRAPRGPRRRLDPDEHADLKQRYRALAELVDPMVDLPPAWRLPRRASYQPAQRYGPRTPLVLARAARLCSLDPVQLATVLSRSAAVEQTGSLTWPIAVAAALARPLGLEDALHQLHADAHHVLALFGQDGRLAQRWRDAVALCEGPAQGQDTLSREYRRALRGLFHDAVIAALAAELLGRDATPAVRLHALGPVLRPELPDGAPPGPEWAAAPVVVAAVEGLVADVAAPRLRHLMLRHLAAREDDEAYEMLLWRLEGHALSSACSLPLRERAHPELQVWLGAVAAAVVHRARLSATEVERLCAPAVGLVPGLRQVLNDPL